MFLTCFSNISQSSVMRAGEGISGVSILFHWSEVSFFFFFLVKFYLFHFSLCWVFVAMQAFSSCRDEGLLLFLVQRLLIVVASLVEHGLQCKWTSVAAEHGLSSGGSWALKHRLNSCGTWA